MKKKNKEFEVDELIEKTKYTAEKLTDLADMELNLYFDTCAMIEHLAWETRMLCDNLKNLKLELEMQDAIF